MVYPKEAAQSKAKSEDNVEKKKQKQAKGLTASCAAQDANETETENVAGSRVERKNDLVLSLRARRSRYVTQQAVVTVLAAASLGTTATFDRKFRSRFDSRIKNLFN